MKGRFISAAGIDGIGKSTQVQMLVNKLRQEMYDVIETKEPGSPMDTTGLGKAIRDILFHTVTTHNMARGVADCLLFADHIQHVEKIIKPALEEGKTVVSDRYSDCEFAYSAAKLTPPSILTAWTELFGPIPDLTLLFISSHVNIMLERAQTRKGINQQDGKAWSSIQEQIAIQNEYMSRLIGQARTTVINVEPEDSPEKIFTESVWPAVKFYLDMRTELVLDAQVRGCF